MGSLLSLGIRELWKDVKDYFAYLREEFRNAGRDEDEMLAWEMMSIPVAPNLKDVKFKAKRGYGGK